MNSQTFKHFSVIIILVLAAFSNVFRNGFVMDDFDFIVHWPLIQDWSNVYRFFVWYLPPDGQPGIYSPFKTVFHAVTYHLFGTEPFGYHVVSLGVHLVSVVFVYRIIRFLTRHSLTAFIGALFFALHPVQVEAITYLTASIDMIGIMFLFAAFDRYILGKRRWAIFFAFLAVFTHELAISLPVLFFWYEFCLGEKRGKWKKALAATWPYFVIVLGYVLAKFLVLGSVVRGGYIYDNFYLTLLVTVKAFVQYIWICLWPLHLTVNHIIADGIYAYGPDDFSRAAVLSQSLFDLPTVSAVLVLAFISLLAWRMFQPQPLVTFAVGWFFLSLLPVSNIIPSSIYFGERYLYPGLLGFCLLAGMFLSRMYKTKRLLAWILLAVLVAGYSLRTHIRNADWRDQVSFYESGVRGNPQSAYMRRDLGIIYFENGRLDDSLRTLKEAIAMRPQDPVFYMDAARVYKDLGQIEQAENFLKKAVELKPDFAEAHYNLAVLYAVREQKLLAKDHLLRALRFYIKSGQHLERYEAQTLFYDYFDLD